MKRLYLVLFALFVFTACVKDFDYSSPGEQRPLYSKQEAQAFFEDFITEFAAKHASVLTRNFEKSSLLAFDFTPQWERAITSNDEYVASVDVPLVNTHQVVAYLKEGDKVSLSNVCQKLVVVKNHETQEEGAYVLTLIPDADYSPLDNKMNINAFINTGEKNNYLGLAVYSYPLTEFVVRLDRYVNGVKTENYSLFGTRENNIKARKAISNILSDIEFGVTVAQQTDHPVYEGGYVPDVIVTSRSKMSVSRLMGLRWMVLAR